MAVSAGVMYPRFYELRICPVCREQVDEDFEDRAGCFHAEYGGYVDPLTLRVPVPVNIDVAVAAPETQAYLAELRRKHLTREAMWEWWGSLSEGERDRREAERRAALTPMGRAFEDLMRASIEDMCRPRVLDQLWSD